MAIRQIATALFDRLSTSKDGHTSEEEGEGEEKEKGTERKRADTRLSQEAGDAYLLFQVLKNVYFYIHLEFLWGEGGICPSFKIFAPLKSAS